MAIGTKVEIKGESEYKKAIKNISSELKVLSSEMKLTSSEFAKSDDAMENARNMSKNLNKQIDQQVQTVMGLSEALTLAKKTYGENSNEVATWQSKLNLAKAELNNLNNKLDENETNMKELEKATDDLGEELEDGGKKATTFGDVLKANLTSEAIIGGIKALGSAVASVGKAFVNIGSQAIEGYADFEQLEGGVKKLFGDDMAVAVKKNANDAFKTAGMTANEYMETVTGFSASLINSLGGDTEKATSMADMAIRDMSDNANTFGTDLSSIQNAYQGFAKGNYTMLDNLKLGFSGSKEGMQELLDKAGEISGKKFDISSFADITEAIHIMQEEMKIAGTTSNEASMTISGSLTSMQGAWSNLITGLADENADLSQLINNMVESVFGKDGEGGVLNNILPRIEVVIDSIVDLLPVVIEKIVEFMPQLLETGTSILQKIMDGITTVIPQLMPVVVDVLMSLVNFIIQNLPMILQTGITILVELVKGIAQALPELIPAVIDAVLLMVETLIDNIDLIIDAGIQLIIGLAEGLIEALPMLIDKIPVIIDKLLTAISENLPLIIEMGIVLIAQLAVGLIKAIPDLIKAIPKIISSIVSAFKNYYSNLADVGKNLLKGLWEGMSGLGDWLWNKVKDLLGGLTKKIKNFFGIKSPSRLFKDEIGTNLALGLGEGFEDTMADVTDDMTNAIPTEFDTNINANYGASSTSSNYDAMLSAFEAALSKMKVVMNDREFGTFVTNTMEKVVYN